MFRLSGRLASFAPKVDGLEHRFLLTCNRDYFIAGQADYAKVTTTAEGDGDFVTDRDDLPYRITITWDDGTTSTQTLAQPNSTTNNIDIYATHNFATAGNHNVRIRVDEMGEPLGNGQFDGFNTTATVRAIAKPTDVDGLIALMQSLYPAANITVTSGQRSEAEQAELMLEQALATSNANFQATYGNAAYTQTMVDYLNASAVAGSPSRADIINDPSNPDSAATRADAVTEFTSIVHTARANGSRVSDHLDNNARDIRIPASNQADLMCLLQAVGARVNYHEPGHAPHWHISYTP
jgi:hypothetical protein